MRTSCSPPVPSTPDLTTMSSNALASASRPWVLTTIWNCWPAGAGAWPICPAATWVFWVRTAAATSDADRLLSAILSGSSQTRIEYSRSPKANTSPTPGMRARSSFTCSRA
jgi:hypothetical protein